MTRVSLSELERAVTRRVAAATFLRTKPRHRVLTAGVKVKVSWEFHKFPRYMDLFNPFMFQSTPTSHIEYFNTSMWRQFGNDGGLMLIQRGPSGSIRVHLSCHKELMLDWTWSCDNEMISWGLGATGEKQKRKVGLSWNFGLQLKLEFLVWPWQLAFNSFYKLGYNMI